MKIYLTFIAFFISKAAFSSEPCTPISLLSNPQTPGTIMAIYTGNVPEGPMFKGIFSSVKKSDLARILDDEIILDNDINFLDLDFDENQETSSESTVSSSQSKEPKPALKFSPSLKKKKK